MKKQCVCILLAAIILNGPVLMAATDEDRIKALEQKFETMQTMYEDRIESLESRIEELEGKDDQPPTSTAPAGMPMTIPPEITTTAPAAGVTTESVTLPAPPTEYSVEWMRQYADALHAIQTQQNTRIEKEKDEIGFEFHGYLRSGFGINTYGNTMSAFQAPGSGAKYRLGNESETYIETTFLAKMPENMLAEGVTFDTQIRLAYVIGYDQSNNSETDTSVRESFGIARGVLEDIPDAAFWGGQRFYKRYDVHMNDFYYRDMSGFGGGIEDVPLWDGDAKLAVALLGGSADDLNSSGTQYDPDDYQLNMNTIDVGLYDIGLFGGNLAFYGTFSDFNGDTFTESSSNDVLTLESSEGLAANFIYDLNLTEDLSNRFVFQYGQGAAANFRALMVAPNGLITTGDETIDIDDWEKMRFLNSILLDDGSPWTYEALLLYEEGDYGVSGDSVNRWASAGIRPVYHFNRHWSLAFEAGVDYTDNDRGGNGTLGKLTIAPQITPDSKHMSRPAIRAFLTYAWWADEFGGDVGGDDYADDLEGFNVGLQLETWW
ncbi:MAG: carbohydrate porin [Planctomycetota bacterium]|jgi:maltoporin